MSTVAPHAAGKTVQDTIFEVAGRARAAKATGGARIIDASIGQMVTDDGELWMLRAVDTTLAVGWIRAASPYAPFLGNPAFRASVGRALPARTRQVVAATPGAAGAIYLMVTNYADPGDEVLVHTPCWPAYASIIAEHGRRMVPWPLLDGERLHTDALMRGIEASRRSRGRALAILNAPAHNPTGYSLDERDWSALIAGLQRAAEPGDPIVLLLDVSYLEFARDPDRERRVFERLEDLPGNVLVTAAWSASKAFALYGWRTGALVAASRSDETLDALERICAASIRGTWGNPPNPGMQLVEQVWNHPSVAVDRAAMRVALAERAAVICPDLPCLPYREGFFAVVRHPNPLGAAQALEERGVFVVPMDEGLRVSIAGVPGGQVQRLAQELQRVCVTKA